MPAFIAPAVTALLGAILGAVAIEVNLLPDKVDLTVIGTSAGFWAMLGTCYGALRRYETDRVARITMAGTLFGALLGLIGLLIALIAEVL